MNIVLREHEWAENMIGERSLGKKPSETLRRVARYYLDEGYGKRKTRHMLDSFLLQCDPTVSLAKWSDALDFAASRAAKYSAIQIDEICISKPEMDAINALKGKTVRKLAFTLLCLAKYWNVVIPNGDSWVNNKESDIMSLANISASTRQQAAMYRTLRDSGMIRFSKKIDNTNVRVCFIKDGKTALKVTDFRNLGYQYLKHCGEPFIVCQYCGITTKISSPDKGKKQKYCKSCAAEVAMKQRVNSVMRRRTGVSSHNETKKYTVYIHEVPNGKKYVGTTTTSLHRRWKNGLGYAENRRFNSDIIKYGWDNIKHYTVISTENEKLAKSVELYLIHKYKTDTEELGYNRASGGILCDTETDFSHILDCVEVDGFGETT